MWKIDTTYREEFQSTFDRLYDKLAVLNQNRPLPYSAISKIKENWEQDVSCSDMTK